MVVVDIIVNACIETYKKLPKTGKPSANEWTVISAIVAVFENDSVKVLSLGTGSKCIGRSSLSPNGDVLNDSHAEVIARRAFLKCLFLQIIQVNTTGFSEILCKCGENNFLVKETVKFYFVTSMSPCGDASIMPKTVSPAEDDDELLGKCLENTSSDEVTSSLKRAHSDESIRFKRLKQESANKKEGNLKEDIHRTGAKCLPESDIQDPHLPGTMYHNIGAVRTKPGRGDPTLSMSCSDKIARWNAVGWQSALLSLFINTPIFVEAIICGGNVPFSLESFNRAVNERILREPFIPIFQSEIPLPDIKVVGKKPNPSCIIWCNAEGNQSEVSINGRRLGVTKKNFNKKSARTSICKKEMFALFERAVNSFRSKNEFLRNVMDLDEKSLGEITYGELKAKAKDYQDRWRATRENCFKVWSKKPAHLLNFTLKEQPVIENT